jgi:hypothetical protein
MKASPVKLSDGGWGARVQGNTWIGQQITIETKAGKKWSAFVCRIVYEDQYGVVVKTSKEKVANNGNTIAQTNSGTPKSRNRWYCPACEEENPSFTSRCWECGCGRK